MKQCYLLKWLFIFTASLTFYSCQQEPEVNPNPLLSHTRISAAEALPFEEGFETSYKGSYAEASVPFTNGTWNFNEALTGNSSSDPKTGTQSARIRDLGKISMAFDLSDGAKSISFSYARYGRDKNSQFEVYYSTNSGSTWTQAGSTFTASKSSLQQAVLPLDVQGNVRFEIRKISGNGYRINIDDVVIEPNPVVAAPSLSEDYESGSKGSYAAASVSLASGTWLFNEALIGTLDSDRKSGLKSARIRDLGTMEMQFDVQGAQSVSISHAVFGTDAGSSWQLEASTDGGASWFAQGSSVASTSTALQTISIPVNFTGSVRFRVLKLSGSGTRINIDDFMIIGSATGGGSEPGDGGGDTGGSPDTTTVISVHLSMGNPSGAVTDVNQPNNYLLLKDQYVMSYSRDRGTANWVSWHLDESWLGSTPRQDDFRSDNTLPASWNWVGSTDYTGSGFDRGHMTPSADRTLTETDNSATFLMTNMIPQAPRNNQGPWATLEGYCRSMLSGGYEIYIISGGYGVGGSGSNGYATTLAGGTITVPSNTWKVILIMPDGNNDVTRVTSNMRVIAVDMPNDQNILSDWRAYRTTIDQIEAKTGHDFFNLVSDDVENLLEAKLDNL